LTAAPGDQRRRLTAVWNAMVGVRVAGYVLKRQSVSTAEWVDPKERTDMAHDQVARLGRRRVLHGSLALAGLGLLAGCGMLPKAQLAARVPRVGFLSASSPSANQARVEAFRLGLRDLGYVEGTDVVFEYRYAEGKLDRVGELADELVRLNVEVILSAAPTPTRAAKGATATIPIVMAYDSDPVGNGFVASLARPGSNVTGLSSLAPGISGKQLQLLNEIVPRLSRVAVLGTSMPPAYAPLALDLRSKELDLTAGMLGVQLQYSEVRGLEDIEAAFQEAHRGQADAAVVLASPILEADRTRVSDLAAQHRLPTIYHASEFVEAGGLVAYGVSFIDLYRRAATYVDKILKGAKPGDLPVEQPTVFDFAINLRTAQTLGLTIPQSVLQQAT
jgi:putative tryptophan/tyrosine transport system substrate-binding protein